MDILSSESNNKRGKNLAFLVEGGDLEEEIEDLDDEAVAMITRNFSKILKQINRSNKGGKSQVNHTNNASSSTSKFRSKITNPNFSRNSGQSGQTGNQTRINQWQSSENKNKNKGMQCRKCEGFGHIQAECATYLKRKKSIKFSTWSDEEGTEEVYEEDEEISGNFVAFTVALMNHILNLIMIHIMMM